MNTPQDPLAQLRPLHLSDPVSWWPPAPGYWLLCLLLIILSGLLFYYLRRTRLKRVALRELKEIRGMETSPEEKIRTLALLLKRYALATYPKQQVAALSGDAWLLFLDQRFGQTPGPFQQGPGRVFGQALYGEEITGDPHQLCGLVSQWIKKNRRKP